MNMFKELNELYKDDPVAFDFTVLNASSKIKNADNILFKNMDFISNRMTKDGMIIYYGARAVNEKVGLSGVRTHIQSTIYYLLDEDGTLLVDSPSIEKAYDIVYDEVNKKY